jgi:Na+/H+ antiporter NhaC
VFLSGALSGIVWGVWIGGVARLLFSVANPYGPPHPWVLAAQVLGGGLIGALGGFCGRWLLSRADRERPGPKTRTAILLAAGVVATLAYDLVTNVAQGIVFGSIPAALAVAVLPTLQHVASNAAIFAVLGNVAFPWLSRHPAVAGRAV